MDKKYWVIPNAIMASIAAMAFYILCILCWIDVDS